MENFLDLSEQLLPSQERLNSMESGEFVGFEYLQFLQKHGSHHHHVVFVL
jgi:hypothetical protein